MVDMTVGDIYGGDYKTFNLSSKTVASAFGKCATRPASLKEAKPADFARSLLDMIGMNIAQLAYLSAMRFKTTRIHFWSKGTMRACFLKHEGYFGALGALANEIKLE